MDIRPLKLEDQDAALELLQKRAPGLSVPPMGSLFGKFERGVLVGIVGVQRPAVVECLVTDGGGHAGDLIKWLDGALINERQWYFFTANEGFQQHVERKYGDSIEGFTGKLYVRRRK
jgi:hypothetical protein